VALPLEVEPVIDPGSALVGTRLHPQERRQRRQHLPWFSGTVLIVFVLAGLIGPWVVPYDPNAIDLANALKPPALFGGNWSHPLGTDDIGRDMLSRIVDGARVALMVSIAVVVIAGIIGLAIAMIAGYRGGRLDDFLMRTTDASLAFPVILFAIVVVGVFGPSTTLVIAKQKTRS